MVFPKIIVTYGKNKQDAIFDKALADSNAKFSSQDKSILIDNRITSKKYADIQENIEISDKFNDSFPLFKDETSNKCPKNDKCLAGDMTGLTLRNTAKTRKPKKKNIVTKQSVQLSGDEISTLGRPTLKNNLTSGKMDAKIFDDLLNESIFLESFIVSDSPIDDIRKIYPSFNNDSYTDDFLFYHRNPAKRSKKRALDERKIGPTLEEAYQRLIYFLTGNPPSNDDFKTTETKKKNCPKNHGVLSFNSYHLSSANQGKRKGNNKCLPGPLSKKLFFSSASSADSIPTKHSNLPLSRKILPAKKIVCPTVQYGSNSGFNDPSKEIRNFTEFSIDPVTYQKNLLSGPVTKDSSGSVLSSVPTIICEFAREERTDEDESAQNRIVEKNASNKGNRLETFKISPRFTLQPRKPVRGSAVNDSGKQLYDNFFSIGKSYKESTPLASPDVSFNAKDICSIRNDKLVECTELEMSNDNYSLYSHQSANDNVTNINRPENSATTDDPNEDLLIVNRERDIKYIRKAEYLVLENGDSPHLSAIKDKTKRILVNKTMVCDTPTPPKISQIMASPSDLPQNSVIELTINCDDTDSIEIIEDNPEKNVPDDSYEEYDMCENQPETDEFTENEEDETAEYNLLKTIAEETEDELMNISRKSNNHKYRVSDMAPRLSMKSDDLNLSHRHIMFRSQYDQLLTVNSLQNLIPFQNFIKDRMGEIYSPDQISKFYKIGEGSYAEVFVLANLPRKRQNVANKNFDKNPRSVFKVNTTGERLASGSFSSEIFNESFTIINTNREKLYAGAHASATELLPGWLRLFFLRQSLSSFETSATQAQGDCQITETDNPKIIKTSGFIKDLNTYYCSGKFPKELLKAWDIFKDQHSAVTCQNERPNIYGGQQIYLIFEQEYGGQTFESYRFADKYEILSFLYQLSIALFLKEIAYSFEHRDLHAGNVLIKNIPRDTNLLYKGFGKLKDILIPSSGIQISIIDFTLSRMTIDGTIHFRDLSKEAELFTGEGDYQFDIYRHMREINKNDWKTYNPATNVYWLHYMVRNVVKNKLPDIHLDTIGSNDNDTTHTLNRRDRKVSPMDEEICLKTQQAVPLTSETNLLYQNLRIEMTTPTLCSNGNQRSNARKTLNSGKFPRTHLVFKTLLLTTLLVMHMCQHVNSQVLFSRNWSGGGGKRAYVADRDTFDYNKVAAQLNMPDLLSDDINGCIADSNSRIKTEISLLIEKEKERLKECQNVMTNRIQDILQKTGK
ncbi:unnamed protein product [Gordionus sp. m RMFG-2023]